MTRAGIADEIHKPARRHYPRRKVLVFGLHDLLQIDLVDMQAYSRYNKGYKYMLTSINCYSKFAWSVGIKSKSATCVTNAMAIILRDKRARTANLQSDKGREFLNSKFAALMKKHKINHYTTHTGMKCAIVERFNRTLKNRMFRQFSIQASHKWIDILPKILAQYNSTRHSVTKMAPINVIDDSLMATVYNYEKKIDTSKRKASVGDIVRISRH